MRNFRTTLRSETATRRHATSIAGLLAALAFILPATAQAAPRATHIVQLRDGVTLAEGMAMVRATHGRVTGRLPIIRGLAVRLSRAERVALARDPRVKAVTVNGRIRPQDADATSTYRIVPGLATAYPYSVLAPMTWLQSSGKGVGVAVVDTGIDGGLVDFEGGDGNSRVIASVVTNPDARTHADGYGHGTHVAGIIAGDGSRRAHGDPLDGKYIGIAPDADLISIKASDEEGSGTILDAIYGLQFAVDHRADYNIRIVNLSVSSTIAQSYKTDPLDAAVESAYFHGILVVAAAGNRGSAADATAYAPGNDPFALSVGAVDDQGTKGRLDDALTDWSSVGSTQDGFSKPEVSAPGAHIVSTLARGSAFGSLCPSCVVDGDYIQVGGTSMAAPVVSGVAALIFEAHPDWTADEVKSTLIATARDVYGGVDEVNAYDAVSATTPASGVNAGVAPNELVDSASGEIDYTRSSWGRSSWGSLPAAPGADWARSSWGCTCGASDTGGLEQTRSSWGSASWLSDFSR